MAQVGRTAGLLARAETAVTASMPSTPRLSIVVVTYKRSESLELTLDDLAAQNAAVPFDVIVVMQGYPAGADEALRERFRDRLHLECMMFPNALGTSRARNIGWKRSRGEIVGFVDDDIRLPTHWVSTVLAFYDDESVGAVGGFVDHPGHFNPARNAAYRLLGLTSNRFKIDWGGFNVGPTAHPDRDQLAGWLSGANMSFRRSAIAGVGGFDEALGTFWHEDADVSHRVGTSGWRVLSSREMTVEHYPSPVGKGPLHEQMRERERSRVLFVWKAMRNKPLWRARYAARLVLQAAAMSVVGLVKRDVRIPMNVLRGGWEGYKGLEKARMASEAKHEVAG
jgi:GT2 family glycosyltransferase